MKICPHCSEEFNFDKPKQFGSHITNCHLNPKRKQILKKLSSSQKGVPKTKKTCDKCDKKISISNFDRHYLKCGLDKKSKIHLQEGWLNSKGQYNCPHCNKEFSKKGICSHIFLQHTKRGDEFKIKKFSDDSVKLKMGWSRGLTKETDKRVKKAAEQQKEFYATGKVKHPFLGRKLTLEHKEKLSVAQINLIEDGGGSNNFKHVKYYKNVNIIGNEYSLRGGYELKISNWLNEKKILWIKGNNFKYNINGVVKTYVPDFYLPEFDYYLETKGYYPEKDQIKMKLVLEQNDINLDIIFKDTIENLDNIHTINELLSKNI